MTRLDVVTGFLGAGKTTFIQRYGAWLREKGVSFCVVENEFGRAGVDGLILRENGVRVREISGGCVCCTMKVTLHDILRELAEDTQRIILEPSGLFCGDDLMEIVESPTLSGIVEMGMWTGIVDPFMLPHMTQEDCAVLKSELIWAGSAVMSKSQLASPEELQKTKEFVENLFEDGMPPVMHASPWEAYNSDEWFPLLQKQGAVRRAHTREICDHTAMFQSATLESSVPRSREALEKLLEQILRGDAGEVLRIKGLSAAQDGRAWHVNATRESISLSPVETAEKPCLNVIGRNLKRKNIREILLSSEF